MAQVIEDSEGQDARSQVISINAIDLVPFGIDTRGPFTNIDKL